MKNFVHSRLKFLLCKNLDLQSSKISNFINIEVKKQKNHSFSQNCSKSLSSSVSRHSTFISSRSFLSTRIHPTAIVHQDAKIHPSAIIGPYCCVGQDVEIEEGVELRSHVVAEGRTKISKNTTIFPFAAIGHRPQDLKHPGGPLSVSIGENCIIREHATIHSGSLHGGGTTRVGSGCLIMTAVHIGHDCVIDENAIISSSTVLAGHVSVGRGAIVGGGVALMQFVKIGCGAMIGGESAVAGDVIPFGVVSGNRAKLHGVNIIGLRRRKYPRPQIKDALRCVRFLFQMEEGFFLPGGLGGGGKELKRTEGGGGLTIEDRVDFLLREGGGKEGWMNVENNAISWEIVHFIKNREKSRLGLCLPAKGGGGGGGEE